MAKWYGVVGYADHVETSPGVWEEKIVQRAYFGDITRMARRLESSGNLNDDINVSNEISIIADPFANDNFHKILFVEFMGTKWKVSHVEVQSPRLILSIGGLYNE